MSTFKQSLYLIVAFTVYNFKSASTLSIGAASDHVTDAKRIDKRAANPQISGDVFPDWVPFKNKHGEELGEFVQVPKAKPKKRLALPMNFKLRPVAAPQDDYFDKVQVDGEGETEYFENKDWNGATGSLQENKDAKENLAAEVKVVAASTTTENNVRQKHKDISDIDGVVSIIQSLDPSRLAIEQNIITTVSPKQYTKYDKESKEEVEGGKAVKLKDTNEEDSDYEELKKDRSKEEKDSDAKKAFILNSVDELKERHASEQKYISEKAKEEERFIEQLERDTIWAKHNKKQKKPKDVVEVNYHDDYDDDVKSVEDKYKIKPRLTTTTPTTTTTQKKTTPTTRVITPRKKEPETAKQSVFRNPRLYMIYEDETESPYRKKASRKQSTKSTTTTSTLRTPKFSSRYVYSPSSSSDENKSESKKEDTEEVERIAFVPEKDSNNGEPTLFFPKRLRVRKPKTTTTSTTEKPESKQQTNSMETTVADATASGSANSVSNTIPIGFFTSPNSDTTGTEIGTGTGTGTGTSTGTGNETGTGTGTGTTSAAVETIAPTATDDNNSTSSAVSAASAPDTTSSASKTSTASTGPTSSDTSASSGEEVINNSIEILDATTTERVRKTTYGRDKTTGKDRKLISDVKKALAAKLTADLDASSTNKHKKEDIKDAGGDHEHESAGGKEYHADHVEEHGEKGKKAYEPGEAVYNQTQKYLKSYIKNLIDDDKKDDDEDSWSAKSRLVGEVPFLPKPWYYTYKMSLDGHHEDSKTAKGHHDKEDHHGKYHDHGGHDHHKHDESEHYGGHHHEEHGKKHAKYEESGKHSKGHSTKGSHDVHKKEEYEKNVEFFEEEGDSGEEEKHGGYNHEKGHASGGKYSKGKLDANSHAHHKGESGHFAKGGHGHGHKGHKQAGGHDSHGKHAQAHFEKESHDGGKKWIYHHGHPAKTANLIVIDRRQDHLQNGPLYYGI